MGTYPDLPDNRLIVNGVDLSVTYQMVLLDGYTLEPPKPKTYTVDIPGGNGVIDLTEALTGDVAYSNRTQKFTFALINVENFEKVKTEISNFLHGKSFSYKMTMDPEYTYHGRFSISSYEHSAYSNGILGSIVVTIDADPYKLKEHCVYRLNAVGGKMFNFKSGRKPVHPIIECSSPCWITWKDHETFIPIGTYRLNDVVFTEGFNELYINSYKLWFVRWVDLKNKNLTWNDLKGKRWDDIQRLGGDASDAPRSWSELFDKTWDDLKAKTWDQLDFGRNSLPESTVYIKYDWEDL